MLFVEIISTSADRVEFEASLSKKELARLIDVHGPKDAMTLLGVELVEKLFKCCGGEL